VKDIRLVTIADKAMVPGKKKAQKNYQLQVTIDNRQLTTDIELSAQ